MYKLDRTKFHKGKIEDQARWQADFWKKKTPEERLAAAWYLCSIAWQFDLKNPPRLDRTAFSARKHTA